MAHVRHSHTAPGPLASDTGPGSVGLPLTVVAGEPRCRPSRGTGDQVTLAEATPLRTASPLQAGASGAREPPESSAHQHRSPSARCRGQGEGRADRRVVLRVPPPLQEDA